MGAEKAFENKVKCFLESEGIYPAGCPLHKINVPVWGWYFKVWGGGFQKGGIPDLICNVNGYFMAVELKSEHGIASELQKKNLKMINLSMGFGIILYPSGFERFKNLILGVKNCSFHIQELSALELVDVSSKCIILKK